MKSAKDRYIQVRAITKEEAIALAQKWFSTEIDKLCDAGKKLISLSSEFQAKRADHWRKGWMLRASDVLQAKSDKLRIECELIRNEAYKLYVKGEILINEGNKLWAEIAVQQRGYIPDFRAMNFIAADREDGVYSLVWSRKEIWFYDGENCPDPETVEVVWRAE